MQLVAQPDGTPIRLAKPTSNLFRFRAPPGRTALDVSAFADVIDVDPGARTADVGGMTTYERLVDATLAHACSGGGTTEMNVRAEVGSDARLAWLPEPLVAHAGCRHRSAASLALQDGAIANPETQVRSYFAK